MQCDYTARLVVLLGILILYLLLCSEGEEWRRQRMVMSKILVPRKVAEFHEDFNAISLDLVKKIQRKRNPETNVVSNTADLFMNWSFESKFHRLGYTYLIYETHDPI